MAAMIWQQPPFCLRSLDAPCRAHSPHPPASASNRPAIASITMSIAISACNFRVLILLTPKCLPPRRIGSDRQFSLDKISNFRPAVGIPQRWCCVISMKKRPSRTAQTASLYETLPCQYLQGQKWHQPYPRPIISVFFRREGIILPPGASCHCAGVLMPAWHS